MPSAVATPSPSSHDQDGESSEAWRLQHGSTGRHRRQFSRATILALGSLVLARRLARARGPCLPVQVQETMSLGSDDALDLVTEGVRLARQAFQTDIETRHPVNEAEDDELSSGSGGGVGKSILASEVVFDRDVVSSDTTRTLLEWVTDNSENETRGRVVADDDDDERADRLGKVMTAQQREQSPPNFIQGVILSSAAAGVGTAAVPTFKFPSPIRSLAYPLSSGGGGGENLSSNDSYTISSDESMRGSLLPSGNSGGVAVAPQDCSTPPLTCGGSNEAKGGGSSASEYATASEGALYSPSPSPSPSPFPSSSVVTTDSDVKAMRTREDGDQGDTTESDSTPASYSPPPPSSPPSSSSSSPPPPPPPSNRTASNEDPVRAVAGADAVPMASVAGGDNPAYLGGRPRGKRGAPEPTAGDQSSQERTSAVEKRPKKITVVKKSARIRGLPPSAAPTSSPEQQKNARWEILIDRVLAALGDGCRCSFCNPHGGGGAVGW